MRLVPLVVLAAIGLDLADSDCAKGSWASEARCAVEQMPGGDCACCLVSEAAAGAADDGAPYVASAVPVPASDRTSDGVRPVPYRPPLSSPSD